MTLQPGSTYSGETAFHEFLKRMQAISPPILYVICVMLLKIKIKPDEYFQNTDLAINFPWGQNSKFTFESFFSNSYPMKDFCRVTQCIHKAGGELFIFTGFKGDHNRCYVQAFTQFVIWLQSGVVVVDDEKKLVTING